MSRVTPSRLPSFNDFSPEIIGDLRACLNIVYSNADDKIMVCTNFANMYFGGKINLRSTKNIPASLTSIGLVEKGSFRTPPIKLTAAGEAIRSSASSQEAAKVLCKHIIDHCNGGKLIDAIRFLNQRGEEVTKVSLKRELKSIGVTHLSTATTDHTTLRNWMVIADILDEAENYAVKDTQLKTLVGASGTELNEIDSLDLAQRLFLIRLRVVHEAAGPGFLRANPLFSECLELFPGIFPESDLRRTIIAPLVAAGWAETRGFIGTGKSAEISPTQKLLEVPIDYFMPNIEGNVPSELRSKINTPMAVILNDYKSENKNKRGEALELLALRMALDLGLYPQGFRTRSKETAYAEADLIAEGSHLIFSRWLIQCKHTTENVSISDVAREVGLAIYYKAHVVVIVTGANFTQPALNYAREITEATHLQFAFVNGATLKAYVSGGARRLFEHFLDNARTVMARKHDQLKSEIDGLTTLARKSAGSVPATTVGSEDTEASADVESYVEGGADGVSYAGDPEDDVEA